MIFHRSLADGEAVCNLFVGQTGGDVLKDFNLSLRERQMHRGKVLRLTRTGELRITFAAMVGASRPSPLCTTRMARISSSGVQSLRRYPIAPALMASKRNSSSA